VTVEFAQVTTPGQISATHYGTGASVPANFSLGNTGGQFVDIVSTATFTGPVTVCLAYDPSQFLIESQIQILHFEGGQWTVPPVVSRDTVNHIVCVNVDSLSPFATVEELPIPGKGRSETECLAESVIPNPNNAPPTDKRGILNIVQTCRDNDPTCDADGGV